MGQIEVVFKPGIGWLIVYEKCIRLGLRQKTYKKRQTIQMQAS